MDSIQNAVYPHSGIITHYIQIQTISKVEQIHSLTDLCTAYIQIFIQIFYFYCVNTSYPMDNCFTGRRDWSRQMTEKVILYKLPAGPVTKCTFARCHLVHTSCLDRMTSSRLFRCLNLIFLRHLQTFILFSLIKNFYCFWSSYGIPWTEEKFMWPHYGSL